MTSAKKLLVLCFVLASFALVSVATGETNNNYDALWSKFKELRQGTRALHQEFEVKQWMKSGVFERTEHYRMAIDFAESKWRLKYSGASRDNTRVFDGQNLFEFDPEGTQYVHIKQRFASDELLPEPYANKLDFSKSKELERSGCGFAGRDHTCIVLEGPIKPWVRPGVPHEVVTLKDGTMRVKIDTETGIWLRARISATVERDSGGGATQWELDYKITDLNYGAASNAALFKLPDGLKEVGYFDRWDDTQIRKQLAGKPAPDLQLSDMVGNPISLASLKGKTVLLDFWATWCEPCKADSSSLEKLNQKFGNKNLAILGISVDEEREVVEKYMQKHPHSFPVVLSSENVMPRAYQITVIPTYMIISPDGTFMTAEEGDKGFAKLRADLQKAGLQTE